ncbi:alpha/beta hydrolase [Ekhidna sp.]
MKNTIFIALIAFSLSATAQKQISFPSKDAISVVADLYASHDKSAPFIILFHQAGYSRGEYQEIAPKLNAMGFNCLAVDLRSGNAANGIENLTTKNARSAGKPTKYVNTIPDIEAAIEYVKSNDLANEHPIIWGSSYSSSLVLKCASYTEVRGVLSFSPGEYFKNDGESGDFITSSVKNIKYPVFITSAKSEKGNWWKMYESISSEKTYFLPESQGKHGSSALWEKTNGNEEYWKAVTSFLSQFL